MRHLLAAIAVVAFTCISAAPLVAATPNVGEHLHVEIANYPLDGHPISAGPHTYGVVLKEHNQTGATRWLRVDDYDKAVVQVPVVLGPCDDCSTTISVTVPALATGRHELRWHLDLAKNSDGNRQYTTARDQVCIVSCSPNLSGRPSPYSGGGGWYTLGGYSVALLRSADSELRPGGHPVIAAGPDATGICAFANPDFHHGSSGTALGCFADTKTHTISLPATLVPGDRLVLVATQANGDAGAYQIALGDGSDRAVASVGWQAWWAKGGVIFP